LYAAIVPTRIATILFDLNEIQIWIVAVKSVPGPVRGAVVDKHDIKSRILRLENRIKARAGLFFAAPIQNDDTDFRGVSHGFLLQVT
jgi:hypothetical protein